MKATVVASAAAVPLSRTAFRAARASHRPIAGPGDSPYGPLLDPDANGLRLPAGFSSRVIARAGSPVAATGYVWHIFPDGGATFATGDGGWVYVCNSEAPVGGVPGTGGGAGAVRFDRDGTVVDAYRILAGTASNCAGGSTPWGTWLSCEEHEFGQVWECDPLGQRPAVARTAMGIFTHEAAAVDGDRRHVYMTEDRTDGCFYRFRYDRAEDLSTGTLEVAEVDEFGGTVTWHAIPFPPGVPFVQATRNQVGSATRFSGGEGCWFEGGDRPRVYFTTKGNHRVWEYDVTDQTLAVIHDPGLVDGSPLSGVDNITVARSGDLYVAEDGGNLEICIITPEGIVAPFVHVVGQSGTELAGVAFDPSGTRLYFSSQRANRIGITYEVLGPFRATAG